MCLAIFSNLSIDGIVISDDSLLMAPASLQPKENNFDNFNLTQRLKRAYRTAVRLGLLLWRALHRSL